MIADGYKITSAQRGASYQVQHVSLDPVFPATVLLLPLLDAHQLVSVPGDQRLNDTGSKGDGGQGQGQAI